MKKVLVAMSGGVDSSAAAYVLKEQGWEIEGVTMRLFDKEDGACEGCCVPADGMTRDARDAARVAEKLGFQFRVLDLREEFRREVIDSFIRAYEAGKTPNPCIECNRHLKFGYLAREAKILGCEAIATGHYARISRVDGRPVLKKAADPSKDQTYVLYTLDRDMLERVIFPLGDISSKDETRHTAQAAGLENHEKKESQDICFVPDGKYTEVIEKYTGHGYEEGDFVDEEGNVLGRHKGIVRYTIGQRKGLGISALPEPYYVITKNAENNTVVLGPNDRLFRRDLTASSVNWLYFENDEVPAEFRCAAKIRYKAKEAPCTVYTEKGAPGRFSLLFDEPQRAVTPGQAVVLYDGDIVIGGGTID